MSRTLTIAILTAAPLTLACHGKHAPTSPGPTTTHVLISVAIDGPPSLAPGASTQLRLLATYSDHTSADVTAQAKWVSTTPLIVTVSPGGLLTAVSRGTGSVLATFTLTASLDVPILEDGTFVVTGVVGDGSVTLSNAQVAVTQGTGQGLTATTDNTGTYALYGVAGNAQLTASHDGYNVSVQSATVTKRTSVNFTLVEKQGPSDFSGNWRLTITPSPSCVALPPEIGPQTLAVAITQSGVRVGMSSSGPPLYKPLDVAGHVTNNSLDVLLGSDFYYYTGVYDLIEQLAPNLYLAISGDIHLELNAGTARGGLSGSLTTFTSPPGANNAGKSCQSVDLAVMER